jgi:MFS family permease
MKKLKQEFKLLKRFYIFYFIWGLAVLTNAYLIIYLKEIGLSFTQISIIASIALAAPIIFEIPTGAIADCFGRKISITLGLLSSSIILFLIPSFHEFNHVVILFFTLVSMGTLVSGSDSAWMVDYLKSKRQSKLIHKAFSRIMSIASLSGVMILLSASFIINKFGLSFIWYIQGTILASAGLFILFFGDKENIKNNHTFKTALKQTFGFANQGFKLILSNNKLFLFSFASFFSAFFVIGGITWQPFFVDLGLPLAHLGTVYAGAGIIGILAPNISIIIVKKLKSEKSAIIFETIISGLGFFIVSKVYSPINAMFMFYIITMGVGIGQPVRATFFHKQVPSKIRATTGSIKNVINTSGAVIAMLIAGYVMDNFGLRWAFMIGGLAAIPTVICYLMIKDDKK